MGFSNKGTAVRAPPKIPPVPVELAAEAEPVEVEPEAGLASVLLDDSTDAPRPRPRTPRITGRRILDFDPGVAVRDGPGEGEGIPPTACDCDCDCDFDCDCESDCDLVGVVEVATTVALANEVLPELDRGVFDLDLDLNGVDDDDLPFGVRGFFVLAALRCFEAASFSSSTRSKR